MDVKKAQLSIIIFTLRVNKIESNDKKNQPNSTKLRPIVRVTSDKQEQQCRQMMASLDKVVNDLDKQEKAICSRARPPLEQNRPVQDSADRLQDLRVIRPTGSFSVSRSDCLERQAAAVCLAPD